MFYLKIIPLKQAPGGKELKGKCQKDSTSCKGIYVSLMCPDQPADVRCCVDMGEYVTNNWVSREDWGAVEPKGIT